MHEPMAVFEAGYIVTKRERPSKKHPRRKRTKRDVWLVKPLEKTGGQLGITKIFFPEHYVGKYVRLKVEIVGDLLAMAKKAEQEREGEE